MTQSIKFRYRERKVAEKEEMRNTLLALNGKIILNNGLKSENLFTLYKMYGFFCNSETMDSVKKYLREEAVIKYFKELWLLEVTEKGGLLSVKDISKTDNWIVESVMGIYEKLENAWGYCNFAMVNDYFEMEIIEVDEELPQK